MAASSIKDLRQQTNDEHDPTLLAKRVEVVDGSGVQMTSFPISGTVAATQSGTWNIGTVTNLSQLGGVAISMNTGVRDTGTQRVTIATNDVVPASQSGTWKCWVTDGTRDATVTTTNALRTQLWGTGHSIAENQLNYSFNSTNYGLTTTSAIYGVDAAPNGSGNFYPIHTTVNGTFYSLDVNLTNTSINVGTVTTLTGITNVVHVDDNAGSLTIDGTVSSNPAASAVGGATPYKLISAATTNATSVKGSAGTVYAIYCHNINAAVRYLKFYDKASAPTVGTDTPVFTLPIPAKTTGAGFTWSSTTGAIFSLGIGIAMTTGVADSDTGAVAANEIVFNMVYK